MSNQPQQPQLPHDIRGLMPYQMPWWEYVLWGAAAVAVAAALLLLGRYLLNRKKAVATTVVDPWLSLEGRLRQLKAIEPFETKAQEEFFYRLSLMLREGIELRTAIPATDRTFKELREPLRRRLPLAAKDVEDVLAFLERADLIKFAEAPSTIEEARACHAAAKTWLEQLKPRNEGDNPFVDLPKGMATPSKMEATTS